MASYRWVHPESGSWARVDLAEGRATVHQSGPRRLWDEMTPVLHSWRDAGQPGIERYGLTVAPDGGHVLWLDHAEQVVATLH